MEIVTSYRLSASKTHTEKESWLHLNGRALCTRTPCLRKVHRLSSSSLQIRNPFFILTFEVLKEINVDFFVEAAQALAPGMLNPLGTATEFRSSISRSMGPIGVLERRCPFLQ